MKYLWFKSHVGIQS